MQFEDLIRQFLSPDNEVRNKAEASIQELTGVPGMLCENLVGVLRTSQDEQVRAVTAVLIRKTITKDYWATVPADAQAKLKSEMLAAVEQEQTGNIRKKISDTVGELRTHMEDGAWPELFPWLFRAVSSPSAGLRESALQIFGQLAAEMDSTIMANVGVLHGVLTKSLQDPESAQVRLAALRATAAVLPILESKVRAEFHNTLPLMLAVLSGCLQAGDEDGARLALEELIDVADAAPQFFKTQMQVALEAMYTVASTKALEDSLRHLAVEFLVTLTEKAPAMVRKMPAFTQHLFPLALNMMLETEDNQEWYQGGSGDEEDTEYTSYDVGEEALDRISIALGGKTLLPIAFDANSPNAIPAFLAGADWRNRHAGLMAISQIGEGCQKQMQGQLPAIVGMLLKHFMDPHPRARWAAINAVGQLCTDFGPDLQNTLHAQVLPALVSVMEDAAQPRVQSHGAAAVINFTENCDKAILQPYLPGLLTKLMNLLQAPSRMVQEQAITAIASVADCAEDLFLPYYATCMPFLKQILAMAGGKDDRMLRGKAMECASLIGIAVGREVFGPDAKEIMDLMMRLQTSEMEPDDPQVSYLLQAWGRIAKCLGEAFQPYLQVVMPPLLKSAAMEPDINITDADDEADEEDQENVETITLNNKRISIKTSVLEEKATACNMICCYVTELQDGFFPYVDPVAKIMVPLMKFIYHDEVRSAAVSCTPELIKCAVSACKKSQCDANFVKQLLDYALKELLESIVTEPDIEVLVVMANALHECINAVGENCLSPEQVAQAVEAVRVVVVESNDRRQERDEKKGDEDFDEEEAELVEEENSKEEELLDEAASCVGALVKCCPNLFVEAAQPLLQLFGQMLERPEASDRRIGLCVFDDIFEHAGALSAALVPQIVPYYFKYSLDADADCRQAAVYGLGVCAQHCQAAFAGSAMEAAQKIAAIIGHPEAKNEANRMATDNAVSALGKICEFQAGGAINAAELAPLWLSHLPVRHDEVEARVVHAQLTGLCERNVDWVFGANHANLPKIVAVLAEVMDTGLADEATSQRMKALLGQIRGSLSGDQLNSVFGGLSPELQAKLR